jgi:hypothetical protein
MRLLLNTGKGMDSPLTEWGYAPGDSTELPG